MNGKKHKRVADQPKMELGLGLGGRTVLRPLIEGVVIQGKNQTSGIGALDVRKCEGSFLKVGDRLGM